MIRPLHALFVTLLLGPAVFGTVAADLGEGPDSAPVRVLKASDIGGLKFRSIGPALMSGRVSDIAVDPVKPQIWYVAMGSGNLWKTTNAGTTWTPIFDDQGSYSIRCLAIDPNDRHTIWVG
ncbi:MAG: WD40/YVTN/BNR-like repeat-containing protein, partial [Phycisphaerales bacterium]